MYQYLYGGKIKIQHLDNENILFEFDCCLEKKPIFAIENKGLMKNDSKNRGNLYIYLTIEGINSVNNSELDIQYSKVLKDTIKLIN